ncbi:CLUMA_CG010878, isoform A [Clunio marinus]|uniref:CLUMA_CG010878, isoform A n=1 Tax=Clunio marinus TaxID=568069 RepID=A0A1J1IGB0_9DIPT|nr:CLUMA_CG010878, isoform A [Clunio marinus]
MTFCVNSHQKQPDNDPKSDAKNPNKISSSDDILKSHNNESVPSTESTSLESKLGRIERLYGTMIKHQKTRRQSETKITKAPTQ